MLSPQTTERLTEPLGWEGKRFVLKLKKSSCYDSTSGYYYRLASCWKLQPLSFWDMYGFLFLKNFRKQTLSSCLLTEEKPIKHKQDQNFQRLPVLWGWCSPGHEYKSLNVSLMISGSLHVKALYKGFELTSRLGYLSFVVRSDNRVLKGGGWLSCLMHWVCATPSIYCSVSVSYWATTGLHSTSAVRNNKVLFMFSSSRSNPERLICFSFTQRLYVNISGYQYCIQHIVCLCGKEIISLSNFPLL